MKYRIRKCRGDKRAWCLVSLRDDGTEIEAYYSGTTSHTVELVIPKDETGA